MTNLILKSNQQRQVFDQAKLAKSLRASCLAVGSNIGEATKYADLVVTKVERWLKTKTELTSQDLRLRAGKELAKYHPEAADFYQNYKTII